MHLPAMLVETFAEKKTLEGEAEGKGFLLSK